MEEHLHCDEVCENPLPGNKAVVVVSVALMLQDVCVQYAWKCGTDFDILQFLPLEVCDGLLQLSDTALGIVRSLLSIHFSLSIKHTTQEEALARSQCELLEGL